MRLTPSVIALTLGTAAAAAAQNPPPPAAPAPPAPPALEVGTVAPDFTLSGATRYGVLREPVRLSDFRGKTVVLAFYFKARTRGLTVQMNAYRDQYAQVFRGGKDVVLIGISADPDTMQANWMRESEFPFLMLSDTGSVVGKIYGAFSAQARSDNRNLFVVGPDGRITYRATPFRQADPTSYTELGAEIARLAPADSTR